MRLLVHLLLACCLTASAVPAALARDEAPAAAAQTLVPFSSEEGLARLGRSTAKVDFPALANQFEPQSNGAFCGPTTTAIVLNTVRGRSADLPRDRSRLRPEDYTFAPAGFDPSVPRFTQDNVIGKGLKTRSQVLGEPVVINGKQIRDFGYQLRQLDELLRAHDLATTLVVVDDKKADADIRRDLTENLQRAGDYVIVAYRRVEVEQAGGGHISPLGAFDAQSDSVLVLDVNPASAGWVWMPVTSLIRAMRTFDTVENRGYILVQAR
ncbi:MAG: phytochelatin synthase family protein [Burkholderiaceae bacterium]